ncbi:MAG: two-component sensor histidine kinase, partial [Acetobacteraceae bacterium]|nr:two-component sensor histidine kinase [Acetobacteraceae bacterium]
MRIPFPYERAIRKALPRSLLGRSLLIILIPLILLQAVALQIYYGSHLNLVYRRLSGGLAGELAFTLQLLEKADGPAEEFWITQTARQDFDLQ